MSTNFFENQDAARRNTKRLVALFGLAVIAIASMLYLLAVLITGVEQAGPNTEQMVVSPLWWQPDLALGVAIATVVVVGGGSLYKIAQLRSGGSVVAEALGGALIPPGTPRRRRAQAAQHRGRNGHRVGHTRAARLPAGRRTGHQRIRGGLFARGCRHRCHAGLRSTAQPRRTPGGHRTRIQPHPQRRHGDSTSG